MAADTTCYLDVTQEAGATFFRRGLVGPVVMLNLLRFRERADYAAHPDLAPPTPISGAEAFDRYVAYTLPFLTRSGGSILGLYEGGPNLIGPASERWDRVMLIRQASVASFLAFADDPAYRAGLGHRTAALADSRLIPLTERDGVQA